MTTAEIEPVEKRPRVETKVPPMRQELALDAPIDVMTELKIRLHDASRAIIVDNFKNASDTLMQRLVGIRDLMRALPSSLDMPANKEVFYDYALYGGWIFIAELNVVNEPGAAACSICYDDYQKIALQHEKWEVRLVRRKLNI